jgi:hypothetical protein
VDVERRTARDIHGTVHEASAASDQDVLRIMEWLEFGTAGEYRRLLPELLFDIGSRIEDSRASPAWAY